MTQLTYRQAARVVHRSIRSIQRWRRNGMPMGWATVDGQRVRVVEKRVLLKHWRERMKADPVHQNIVRAKIAAETAAQPRHAGIHAGD